MNDSLSLPTKELQDNPEQIKDINADISHSENENKNESEIDQSSITSSFDFENECHFMANVGKSQIEWKLLKPYIISKYENVIRSYSLNDFNDSSGNANHLENISNMVDNEIVKSMQMLQHTPFTLQRICELLLDPKKYYKTAIKFNKAFSKLVNLDIN